MNSNGTIQTNSNFPSNSIDASICEYIEANPDGDYRSVLKKDKRLAVARYLSDIPNGLFAWYPFDMPSCILVIGSHFGAFLDSLARRCDSVVVLEGDKCRARAIRKRFDGNYRIECVESGSLDATNEYAGKFDYVIWTHDENQVGLNAADFERNLVWMKNTLKSEGKLLAVVPNKFGVRNLCGERFGTYGLPFEGLCGKNNLLQYSKREIVELLTGDLFNAVKLYYVYPDYRNPQIIYTDEYAPSDDIGEKLRVYIENQYERVQSEISLCESFGKEGILNSFANHFIVECGNNIQVSNIQYSAITSERSRYRAFVTNICSNGIVQKAPIYEEGVAHLDVLSRHSEELASRGVPSLKIAIVDGVAEMDRICAPTLSQHLRSLVVTKDESGILQCADKLYQYIFQSSDPSTINAYCEIYPEGNWGLVLKKAFVEMIPVNCFYVNGDYLFFDQEYALDNCPAGYVMFRAVNDIYKFVPEMKSLISKQRMCERYGLHDMWPYYECMESLFCSNTLNIDMYGGRSLWLNESDSNFVKNRKILKMHADSNNDLFNTTLGLGEKGIIVFGAGKYSNEFINRVGSTSRIVCILDNNSEMWGTSINGIPVQSPNEVEKLDRGSYRIVIAVANYSPIVSQLNSMGIYESDYRIFDPGVDALLSHPVSNSKSDGKYNIGYVTGAFDLFHIGHLNLLKRCKERCHYLVAGVLTDTIIEVEKHKNPFIPFEERMEIVKQCRYVDRVVAVDSHNTDKVDAWKELRYGCLFSGSDHEHEPYWVDLQMRLRSLGSELEFFPYTMSTSSTMLQKAISEKVNGNA